MKLTIDMVDGCGLSNKRIMNYCQGNPVFAIHFTVKGVLPVVR